MLIQQAWVGEVFFHEGIAILPQKHHQRTQNARTVQRATLTSLFYNGNLTYNNNENLLDPLRDIVWTVHVSVLS